MYDLFDLFNFVYYYIYNNELFKAPCSIMLPQLISAFAGYFWMTSDFRQFSEIFQPPPVPTGKKIQIFSNFFFISFYL